MTALDGLPPWLMGIVALLVVLGSSLTLIGTIGLVQLRSFFDRIHAPTLGTSWGAASILIASLISWSWIEDRIFLHELVIGVFIMVTTPVTMMLLGRATLHRQRAEARLSALEGGSHDIGNAADELSVEDEALERAEDEAEAAAAAQVPPPEADAKP
ncbi:monovalent cation/H(+) antiporter subunit G [Xinfangfangia sp. CPCC 101601]|uniref:Monovalent cation/H(+) antiporter subunit G n=1 Tax=Pseudogemmobacter lacusdianii TaxID=3069608 RepID=A0ABU0VZZ3_9RHOB|nr:monovalent cation/H(+) antiporter subunit G [Xinfangfangia sp. CPCC 101601]MDQ2067308.1 monovalent cation/H(+) antiporter subunit G [Xinfangfangia sp. CPCC 101601]